jgi:hypothetical protein
LFPPTQLLPKEQWLPAFALEALIQPSADVDADEDEESSVSVPTNSLAAVSGMASLPILGSLRPTGTVYQTFNRARRALYDTVMPRTWHVSLWQRINWS